MANQQPAWSAPQAVVPPPGDLRSWAQRNPRRVVMIVVIVVLVVVAAIIGKSLAGGESIAVGDCVQTNPTGLQNWDIKKVACGAQVNLGDPAYQVTSVQDGTNGYCPGGETTFEDDPANKTYCLSLWYGGE